MMKVKVTPTQFLLLQECAIAFENGLRGPHGWTQQDAKEQLAVWSMARGGNYDRFRHDMGEPVHIEVTQ